MRSPLWVEEGVLVREGKKESYRLPSREGTLKGAFINRMIGNNSPLMPNMLEVKTTQT